MNILARFRGFHRDTGGQISFLMVVGAVALAILLGWLGTTGYQVAGKVEAQAAADAAALSGGVWIARGLNLTSAINVIQSQLVAGAILLNSLEKTLRLSIPAVGLQCISWQSCSWFSPFCAIAAIVTCTQARILPSITAGVAGLARILSYCPTGVFWLVAKGLQFLNTAIHYSFFAIATVETVRAARANDASAALLLPGRLLAGQLDIGLLTLPTEKREFPALCDPMERGSPSTRERGYAPLLHYAPNQGPLLLGECRISNVLTFLTGVPPVGPAILPVVVDAWKAKLCSRGSVGPITYTQRRPAESLEECARQNGTATWLKLKIVTKWLDHPLEDPNGWLRARMPRIGVDPNSIEAGDLSAQLAEAGLISRLRSDPFITSVWKVPEEQIRSCDEFPKRRSRRRDVERHGMFSQSTEEDTTKNGKRRYKYSFWVWILLRTEVEVEVKEEFASDCDGPGAAGPECAANRGSCTSVLPAPYLLRDGSPLPYLALATRENRRVWFTENWRETPPTFVTYAQVEVYNGVGLSGEGDAFTQDWRVRLQRATLVDSIWERVDLGSSSAAVDETLGKLLDFLEKLPVHDGRLERALDIARAAFGTGRAETAPYLPEDVPIEGETPTGEPAWRAILNH